MEYFENTTRITEDGYAAILRLKNTRGWLCCRLISLLLMAPLAGRVLYILMLLLLRHPASFRLQFTDFLFVLLCLVGLWLWHYPSAQVQARVRRTKNQVDLQAVNQYTFLPEEIHMMTTSSLQRFRLHYEELTWIRSTSRWMVLYFRAQDFTMLIDRNGFTRGNARACQQFLQRKIKGN